MVGAGTAASAKGSRLIVRIPLNSRQRLHESWDLPLFSSAVTGVGVKEASLRHRLRTSAKRGAGGDLKADHLFWGSLERSRR